MIRFRSRAFCICIYKRVSQERNLRKLNPIHSPTFFPPFSSYELVNKLFKLLNECYAHTLCAA